VLIINRLAMTKNHAAGSKIAQKIIIADQ